MSIMEAQPTCYYHPIKVLFLDDSRTFLDALDIEFGMQINMLTITNPHTAMQIIENHSPSITKSVFKLINDVNTDTSTDRIIGFEVGNILNHIYNKTRFDHIAILVIDYNMPEINGLEFCQKLKDRKIFRILLTAEADKDTAIKAFNNNLIDKFILKTSEELYPEITLAIEELTQRYFQELSCKIINEHTNSLDILFENELYLQLFTKVVSQVKPIEYYMVDNSGSFLFLDKDANPTWLIVKHNNELDEQIELLKGYDVPERIMESITQKEKILYLLSENEYKKPISEWFEYMFDSTQLDNNYHYSIVQDKLSDSIDWCKVASYSTYNLEK